jgi:hypothetical protein
MGYKYVAKIPLYGELNCVSCVACNVVCAVVLHEGLQVNHSFRCCIVPLCCFILQDDIKDGVISISVKCCLNEFSISPFYICETVDKKVKKYGFFF